MLKLGQESVGIKNLQKNKWKNTEGNGGGRGDMISNDLDPNPSALFFSQKHPFLL